MKAAPTIAEERIPLSQKYAELLRVQKEVDASNRLYPTTRTGFFKVLSFGWLTKLGLRSYTLERRWF